MTVTRRKKFAFYERNCCTMQTMQCTCTKSANSKRKRKSKTIDFIALTKYKIICIQEALAARRWLWKKHEKIASTMHSSSLCNYTRQTYPICILFSSLSFAVGARANISWMTLQWWIIWKHRRERREIVHSRSTHCFYTECTLI